MPGASPRRPHEVVSQLRQSQIYRDYERAFRETTGLPLTLRPLESFAFPHEGDPKANPFCVLMAQTNHSCSACLQVQQKLEAEAQLKPKTLKCFAGLCDTAVPVRVGENVVAFLLTGQIVVGNRDKRPFSEGTKALLRMGSQIDLKRLEEAYLQSRVVTRKQYESIVRLLEIFAMHLATLSNQLMLEKELGESPAIARARAYIAERQDEPLSLNEVARAINMSAYYFCKVFHKATGLTFTDYLARLRVERVKELLLNPHKRVSEAAFEAGFQSLSQFNRVFRRVAGEAPSTYRTSHGVTTL